MNYLMGAWRFLYALIVLLLSAIAVGVILGLIISVGVLIGWVFNHLMDDLFHGTRYTQEEDEDK